MKTETQIRRQFRLLGRVLDERGRRLWAATEAQTLGRGGISRVSRATGISRPTIHLGLREIKARLPLPPGRSRRAGGGRKSLQFHIPDIRRRVEILVEPLARGDPESPLRWTCKSTRQLADELRRQGLSIGHSSVAGVLARIGYSLQGNRKTQEGKQHPDRNAQFEHINNRATAEMAADNPVISVDTKKKELVGNYKNHGREGHPKGKVPAVNDHDFPDPSVPRAHPYGVYDLARNTGWVNIGTDRDTAAFAVASIRGWWEARGNRLYPEAKRLLITADAGGSNGSRLRLWKWELQGLANYAGVPIEVCHFPPGTSKWNKIEHRLFSFISRNWRGHPLVSYETIVKLIRATTTKTGLRVACRLDRRRYAVGREITDEQMTAIRLVKGSFHGEWNYTIHPHAVR